MPSVHRDSRTPKGVYFCHYVLADGRRASRSTGTKNKSRAAIICASWQAAERAAADGTLSESRAAEIINETLARIGQSPVVRLKLADWLKEWLAAKTNVTPQILKRYRFASNKFLEFLGPDSQRRLLESVNEADVRRFAAALKADGRCATTINRIIRADLGNAFNRAVNLGKLRYNPVAGVEPEKDKDKRDRIPFTVEQVAGLIKACRGSDWEGAIRFAYSSGARLQDVANLTWAAIDLEVGVVLFRQKKTGRQTAVAIHPDFQSWLLAHVSDDAKAFVFPALANRSSGGKGLSFEFNAIVDRAGIDPGFIREKKGVQGKPRKNLTFHNLRHVAASSVFNAAAVKETARRLTGHAAGGAIDRYIHIDLSAVRNAGSLIPRLPLSEA
jgi:integrase